MKPITNITIHIINLTGTIFIHVQTDTLYRRDMNNGWFKRMDHDKRPCIVSFDSLEKYNPEIHR